MPIDTRHPLYDKYAPIWEECTLALQGQYFVKKHDDSTGADNKRFLPATQGMIKDWSRFGKAQYEAYKQRARFPDFAASALNSFVGLMTTETPLGDIDEVVTNNGLSVYELSIRCARNASRAGRHVLVIDAPTEGGQAFIAQYPAESFVDWKTDKNGNLIFAKFREYVDADPGDNFSHDEIVQYRIFTPGYVQVFNEDGDAITELMATPSKGMIPVVVIGAIDNDVAPDMPPLYKIVECAIRYYQLSADYGAELFQTSLAQPWVSKVDKSTYNALIGAGIGGGVLWNLGETGVCGFAQPGAQTVAEKRQAMLDEEAKALSYSAQLTEKAGVESGQAIEGRDSSIKAPIETMASAIDEGINKALEFLAMANGRAKYAEFQLVVSKSQAKPEAGILNALGQQINAGNMPQDTLFNYAVDTGLYSDNFEQWRQSIDSYGGNVSITEPNV